MSYRQLCLVTGVEFVPLFTEWLKKRKSGSKFMSFRGTDEEIGFVEDYVEGW
jgi:hypothetical protein